MLAQEKHECLHLAKGPTCTKWWVLAGARKRFREERESILDMTANASRSKRMLSPHSPETAEEGGTRRRETTENPASE